MSDRPTPETDDQPIIYAINDNGYQVPCLDIEFARKLERERDEAWKIRDEAVKQFLLIKEELEEFHKQAEAANMRLREP